MSYICRHALLFEGIEGDYNLPVARKSTSLRQFDEAFTRVGLGLKSADEFYQKVSSKDSIPNVCRPLLCIQAANDPIAHIKATPREDIENNPNCMLIVTPKGGHLGWVAGTEAPFGTPWTDPVVMDFLEHLEKKNGSLPQNMRKVPALYSQL
ncbi:embryogenesis-associated protein EMB8-like protein [Tanacetum coccineum]